MMFLIQHNIILKSQANTWGQPYNTFNSLKDLTITRAHSLTISGTLSFNYYTADNITRASLNLLLAAYRLKYKLTTFN